MRILITGGAGFIGGHLTERLLQNGYDVVVIDNLSTGNLDNLVKAKTYSNFTFIHDDITSMNNLEEVVSEVDVVFHLAAAVGVELVVNDPIRTITTNVQGTEKILKAAVKFDRRTIIASTSEVYGKSSKDKFTESDDLLIGCPVHSRWSYACSKLLDEFYLMAYCRSEELRGTVVRFFNTVGPRQTGQYGMVIPRFVGRALKGEALSVYGDGTQSRCFCHVFDTIRALEGLIDCPDSHGKIFNIGSQNNITIEELAKKVVSQLGSKSKIEKIPYEQAYAAGFEDMLRRVPDTEAIHQLLGWQAEHTLEDIINDVAQATK